MSYNLSRTLFYEFYKSDPNFIYESVEEYRNYKSDPNFTNKSLEEYRRFKASEASEKSSLEESATSESIEVDSDESNQQHLENENTTRTIETENEIEMKGMMTEGRIDEVIEKDIDNEVENEIENEIFELEKESMTQKEFERSLEQFWNCDEEIPSRFTSETELGTKGNKKKTKSKFRIPKSKSTLNFNNVKSRYLDVFKKN